MTTQEVKDREMNSPILREDTPTSESKPESDDLYTNAPRFQSTNEESRYNGSDTILGNHAGRHTGEAQDFTETRHRLLSVSHDLEADVPLADETVKEERRTRHLSPRLQHHDSRWNRMYNSGLRAAECLRPTFSYMPSVTAAVFYALVSTSMAFLNKLLLATYSFNFPLVILTLQMILTEAILLVGSRARLLTLPHPTWDQLKPFLTLVAFSTLNSALSLTALESMNLTMYSVLKRCGPMVTLLISTMLLQKQWPGRGIITSVAAMTIGCVVAAWGDLTFHAYTYAVGAAAVVSQAVYLTLLQRLATSYSTIETLQNTSLLAGPVLALAAVVTGETKRAAIFVLSTETGVSHGIDFWVLLLAVLSAGCLLSYSLFQCNRLNSALTTSVVGTVKSVFQTTVGLFTFGGVAINAPLVIGITMNMGGGVAYTFSKYMGSRKKSRENAERQAEEGHELQPSGAGDGRDASQKGVGGSV